MLSLANIAQEIQQSLDFLETNLHNVPSRHRSIQAVFERSWQRLGQAERDVLPQLSVFRSGFTRQAVQTITRASLRTLGKLVNKSLLQYNQARDRYFIHELLRQYSAEKLKESGRETAVCNQHSSYYLKALHEREEKLKGREQQIALSEIEADVENARKAWMWAIEQGDASNLAKAMDTLGLFFEWTGSFQDGAMVFQALLNAPFMTAHANSLCLVRTLGWDGLFQRVTTDVATAMELLMQGLAIIENLPTAVDGRNEKGFLLLQKGKIIVATNHAEAKATLMESLYLFRSLNNPWATASVLQNLGEATWGLGDYVAAAEYLDESIRLNRSLGNLRGLATATLTASINARYNGHHDKSFHLAKECLELIPIA